MFSNETFHVIICVLWFVVWFIWVQTVGMFGDGRGWEYSCIGSLHFSDSISNCCGKIGNLSVIICMVSGILLCLMKLYSSASMVLSGLIMSWFVWRNCVYECVVKMCLSGGFGV